MSSSLKLAIYLFSAIVSITPLIVRAADIVGVHRDSMLFLTVEHTEPTGKKTTEYGTGFVISGDGHILTAGHLLYSAMQDFSGNVRVSGKRRSRNSPEAAIPLETIAVGCCDLVLLKIPDQGIDFEGLKLADTSRLREMKSNDPLVVLGFGLQNDLATSNGTLGNKGGNFIQGVSNGLWLFNAPVNHGNSGSPVFDSNEIVIGIVKGGIDGAQGSNYLIPINYAKALTISVMEEERQQQLLATVSYSSGFPYIAPHVGFDRLLAGDRFAKINILAWSRQSVPVCWENPSGAFSKQMRWVQSAVESTWQANSSLAFPGWGKCNDSSNGVRILIDDAAPATKALGRQLDGIPHGMVLNFTFGNWLSECKKTEELCIKGIAIQAFGRALGFTQAEKKSGVFSKCVSADAPRDAKDCGVSWQSEGRLSDSDVLALQALYGVPATANREPVGR